MIFLRLFFPVFLFSFFGIRTYINKPVLNKLDFKGLSDSTKRFSQNFYPQTIKSDQVIKHVGFTLCYDENYEQAKWVAYRLTDQMSSNNNEARTDNFREDPMIRTGSAVPNDFKKTGYDRGHLCPAGDMGWSEVTMSESFFMSNMSPQQPKFNRGIWKTLEMQVREWAQKEEELYIVTAGVLEPGLTTIGVKNKIAVPKYYYKIILDVFGPQKKAIAFVMPNKGSKASFFYYAVSIDSVERLTQINFFPALPDSLEENLEAGFNVELWQ
jgi:endonuclease G